MLRKFFLLFGFIILFFYGCSTKEQVTPKVEKKVTVDKNTTVEKKQQATLQVNAPKGATIRILNIKPKYFDGIELDNGDYLIEVTKKGYDTVKKWITVDKSTIISIDLQKQINMPTFTWNYDHQQFCTLYDPKTQLIWALPNEYVDYVKKQHPKEFLQKTLGITSRTWPRIDRTKLDTIIYNGTNALTLYNKSKRDSKKEYYSSLDKLTINTLQQSWRIPKKQEIYKHNPFKTYQQYYQVIWNKGHIVKMNIPLIYTYHKDDGHTYYSALGYKRKATRYNSAVSSYIQNIKHSLNIALITPVRSKKSTIDTIVYDQRRSLDDKFLDLYTLLHSTKKTIKVLLGDPKLRDIYYDQKKKRLRGVLYSTTNNFQTKFSLKISPKKFDEIKQKILDERLIPSVRFKIQDGILVYRYLTLKRNRVQEIQAYKEAKRSDNINLYREYIRMYPNTPEAKKLQKLIEKEYKGKYSAL